MTGDRMTCAEALDVARRWAARGVPAFPVAVSWDDAKQGTDKRPLTDHGHDDATTDPAELEQLFNCRSPKPGEVWGVGLHPGPAGWAVVDVDVKAGDRGDDTWADLTAQHGKVDTYTVTTASGGAHVWGGKGDRHISNAHSLGPGIDLRADRGWVVAPGTRTPWGTWAHEDSAPHWPPILWPAWVLDRLTASSNGQGGPRGRWAPLDRTSLHPADLATLEALEQLGGHDPYIGGDGALMIVRPGKTAGGSASIGHIAPGVVKMFTRNWPPLRQNAVYDPDWLTEIADAVEAGDREHAGQIADPGYWNERLILDPEEVAEAAAALEVTVVTLDQFAAVDEPGAQALLGDGADTVIPAGGDVMIYGAGGAGKTTLTVDLACHLAAGDNWLGITVARPLTVLMIENEGPRPLFRVKVSRKLDAWTGAPLGGRARVIESPWATLGFADEAHRHAMAKIIAEHGCDLVIVGPLTRSGMTEAGTLTEVRQFLDLVADVRHRCGRTVTFVLVHHENKGGQVSGAWEGAGDTLLHVQGMGHGRTRLYVQKARWSPTWHAQALELRWTDGESYAVDEKPELSDEDIADRILAAVSENPGTGWSRIEEMTPGIRAQHRRAIRDRLLTGRQLVNVVKENGGLVALDHCPERRPARLHLASDPTITHLRPDPDAAGTQSASARDGAPTASASLRPDSHRDAGRDADAGGPSDCSPPATQGDP